jgi:extracellular factor (EF) 3-hydroxypalmitic acid methyl ester biosynthesis protein
MANMENNAPKESVVLCRTNQGIEIRAGILRLTRHLVVFEIITPGVVLQLSEVLGDFKILLDERAAYSGRAVISSVVHTGTTMVCEATLDEACLDARTFGVVNSPDQVRAGFEEFVRDWGKSYRILPEFKLLISDMHNYLSDLRLWLEQVELGIRSAPSGDRSDLEREVLTELRKTLVPSLNALFEKFEVVASRVEPGDKPAHRLFVRRQIHPLVFCAPFAYRTLPVRGRLPFCQGVQRLVPEPAAGGSASQPHQIPHAATGPGDGPRRRAGPDGARVQPRLRAGRRGAAVPRGTGPR